MGCWQLQMDILAPTLSFSDTRASRCRTVALVQGPGFRSSFDYGINFPRTTVLAVARDVPSGSTTDVNRKRTSRMLSSHTRSAVAVRIRFPDRSNSLNVVVPAQSGLTCKFRKASS